MAKNQNTFAKRQRERKKKEKAQLKRERRLTRKQSGSELVAGSKPEDDTLILMPIENRAPVENE